MMYVCLMSARCFKIPLQVLCSLSLPSSSGNQWCNASKPIYLACIFTAILTISDITISSSAGRSIGGCTNVRATMYFIRSFSRSRKPRVNRCTNQVQCEEQDGKNSLVKLKCEKGYQINLKYARDYCMLCEGTSSYFHCSV